MAAITNVHFRAPGLLLLTVWLSLLVFSSPASAGTIAVTTTSDQLNAVAPCSLREAVRTANADANIGGCADANPAQADTIVLGGGDHDLTIAGTGEDTAVSGDLDVTQTLTVRGNGAAHTGVDGNGTATFERVFHVLSPAALNIASLTIHDGRGDSGGGGVLANAGATLNLTSAAVTDNEQISGCCSGGGIRAEGTVTLTDSTVSGNGAFRGGGVSAGTATLINSTVSGNRAGFGGGGGVATDTATVTNSTVSGNSAASGSGGITATTVNLTNSVVSDNTGSFSAGIFADSATLKGSAVSGNRAFNDFGGGIWVRRASTLTDTTVSDNSAATDGGGIRANGALTLTRSEITNNHAEGGRGGGIFTTGRVAMAQSTIAANDATGRGGGMALDPSTATLNNLTNSTLSGNESGGEGGGLYLGARSTTTLANVTITRNFAGVAGGGLYLNRGEGVAQANIRNSIVARNRATFDSDCSGNATILTSQDYNLIGDRGTECGYASAAHDQVGTSAAPIDPQLGFLANNGGPTRTHALLANSPAINSGNPAAPGSGGTACAASDQRGVPRALGGRCDKGAYERVTCRGKVVNRVGTNNADILVGTAGADGILALGGSDFLFGRGGNDGLCGGAGNDQLSGEGGADFLDGGPGTDSCNGGTEQDQAAGCETTVSIP